MFWIIDLLEEDDRKEWANARGTRFYALRATAGLNFFNTDLPLNK